MPNVSVFNATGKKVGTMDLSEKVFGIVPNMSAVHLVVVNYLANQRQGTQSTLTRAEVSGGGKKPWRQKGTGRARQGSTRSPQWTHGGIALGPKPRTYGFSINKKVRRLAMFSVLSDKVANDEFTVVDNIELKEIKTKEMVKVLEALGKTKKTLIVLPEKNDNIYKSARNIPGVENTFANLINVYDLLNAKKIVVEKAALAKIEEVFA